MPTITVLGATGSIGASTLDLVRRNRDAFRVVALTANAQAVELAALARELDRKSTRLNSSHVSESRMPSSA